MTTATVPLKSVAELLVSNVDKKSQDGEVPVRLANYVDVYYNDVLGPDLDYMQATATPAEIEKFTLRGGETVITKDSEDPADIAVPSFASFDLAGVVCGYHLAILKPRADRIHPKFLFWAMSSDLISSQFSAVATGVTRFGLRQDAMRAVNVPLPPLDEQRRIADFLDRETARIDELAACRQRFAELIQARTAQGLEDWIWGTLAASETVLKYELRAPLCYGVLKPAFDDPDARIPLIRVGDLAQGKIAIADLPKIPAWQDNEFRRTKVATGDLLIAVVGATVGKTHIVQPNESGANLSRAVAKVQLRRMPPEYVEAVIGGQRFKQFHTRISNVTAQPVLNLGDLKEFRLPVPESLERPEELLASLHERQSGARKLFADLTHGNQLLTEYRRALITEAVTGQLDISRMPDAAAEERLEEVLS